MKDEEKMKPRQFVYKTKQELVYNAIKDQIVEGKYELGSRLVIRQLAEEFSVSESPVREALLKLESENFLEYRKGSMCVTPISAIEFIDSLQIRLELEKIAIKFAAIRASEKDLKQATDLLNLMQEACDSNNLGEYENLHQLFHVELFNQCNVAYLINAVILAIEHSRRGIIFFNLKSWKEKPSMSDHQNLLTAVRENNPEAAVKCLENNRSKAFELYRTQITDRYNLANSM